MRHIIDQERIDKAMANGFIRKKGERAAPHQALAYVLSDKRFYRHANLSSAKAEKDFLQAALGRKLRIYKVWNADREAIEADMTLLRNKLTCCSE